MRGLGGGLNIEHILKSLEKNNIVGKLHVIMCKSIRQVALYSARIVAHCNDWHFSEWKGLPVL